MFSMAKVNSLTGKQHVIVTNNNVIKGAITIVEFELLFSYQFIPTMKSNFDHTKYTNI